jgi:hypothetical protein
MPQKRKAKTHRDEFTDPQFFELRDGPDPFHPAFASPFLQRAAYYEHKEELMESDGPGQRCWGWWEYEAGGQHPATYDDGTKWLRRHGLLSASEEAQLQAEKELRKGRGKGD